MSLSISSDEKVPSNRLLSADSSHQKGEAGLMYHWKELLTGADSGGIFNKSIGKRKNRRVE
jgi:hypothetical protein